MTNKQELEFYKNFPLAKNPYLDKQKPHVEQLVQHICRKNFRVFVNGHIPISDTTMIGVICPHCDELGDDYITISGHSGGIFNVKIGNIVLP